MKEKLFQELVDNLKEVTIEQCDECDEWFIETELFNGLCSECTAAENDQ